MEPVSVFVATSNRYSTLKFVVTKSVLPSGETASANGSPWVAIASVCVFEATSMMPTLSDHWFDTKACDRAAAQIDARHASGRLPVIRLRDVRESLRRDGDAFGRARQGHARDRAVAAGARPARLER